MRRLLSSVFSLLLTACAFSHAQKVKHGPTVEQCRADQRLWLSKLEQQPHRSGLANVSYGELNGWMGAMMDCQKVDPAWESRYDDTMSEAEAEMVIRFTHFLDRCNLYNQFLAEDAQGKR